jgi:hypothetical protein
MNKPLLLGALVASLWAHTATAAPIASTDLAQWTRAGDVVIDSGTSARITTAAVESGEQPLSASGALLFFDLEPALGMAPGTLPADTIEGSGLQFSFSVSLDTTIRFAWSLGTALFDADYIDRAFVVIDGSQLASLADVDTTTVNGLFSYTFGAGDHSLAFGIMDVNATDLVSTLDISDFSVSAANAVPEPGSLALVMAGIAGISGFARRRRRA